MVILPMLKILTSKLRAGGTYIILLFRRYVITSAGAGDERLAEGVRIAMSQCAYEACCEKKFGHGCRLISCIVGS
jgi:hypothetical protein